MRFSPLSVFPFGILLLACSGSEGTSSTGSGGPSATAPEGAVNMEIYATVEQSCPIGNVHIDVGNSRVSPPELAVDAYQGAAISCAVVPKDELLSASGSIQQGSFTFSFKDVVTAGDSATGQVTVKDPAAG